jgi:hypothetical protein
MNTASMTAYARRPVTAEARAINRIRSAMEDCGLYCPHTDDLASTVAACEREFMRAYLDDDESQWLAARTAKLLVDMELSGLDTCRSVHVLSHCAPPWRCV